MAHIVIIFLFPFLIGFLIRKGLSKHPKKHLFTISSVIAALLILLLFLLLPSHGSELYSITFSGVSSYAVGALLAEMHDHLKK